MREHIKSSHKVSSKRTTLKKLSKIDQKNYKRKEFKKKRKEKGNNAIILETNFKRCYNNAKSTTPKLFVLD